MILYVRVFVWWFCGVLCENCFGSRIDEVCDSIDWFIYGEFYDAFVLVDEFCLGVVLMSFEVEGIR